MVYRYLVEKALQFYQVLLHYFNLYYLDRITMRHQAGSYVMNIDKNGTHQQVYLKSSKKAILFQSRNRLEIVYDDRTETPHLFPVAQRFTAKDLGARAIRIVNTLDEDEPVRILDETEMFEV
jgi:hypothetical protein